MRAKGIWVRKICEHWFFWNILSSQICEQFEYGKVRNSTIHTNKCVGWLMLGLNIPWESFRLQFRPLLNFSLECKKLDGILSILEGVVHYFKLCAVLGRRKFHPNTNTKFFYNNQTGLSIPVNIIASNKKEWSSHLV
jgi:hypothetical protein